MLLERLARVTVLRSVLSEVFDKAGYRLEFDTAEGQTWRYEAEASTGAATSTGGRHLDRRRSRRRSRHHGTAARGRAPVTWESDNRRLRQQEDQTEPRRARAPAAGRRTCHLSTLPGRPPTFDVLRPLPFDTPLLSPVWFRPSGRPILGGIQG